jgi:hypothetical protein
MAAGLEVECLPRTMLEDVYCGGEGDVGGEQEDDENGRRSYRKSKSEPKPEEEPSMNDDDEQGRGEEDGRGDEQGREDEYAGDVDQVGADEHGNFDESECVEEGRYEGYVGS